MHLLTECKALYKLAHQLENSLLCSTLSPPLQHGLNNWRRLWPSAYRDCELLDVTLAQHGLWFQRIGFQRYAPEYWLYTYLAIERAQSRSYWSQEAGSGTVSHDDTDKTRFTALLREFASMKLTAS